MPPAMPHAGVDEEFVLKKCAYFRDVGLWPRTEVVSPEQWLSNFTDEENPYAVQLLNSFQYFSEDLTNELFAAAFQGISSHVWLKHGPSVASVWASLVDRALICPVEGERPNPTDSGYLFARRARQLLEIDEARILRPRDALFRLLASSAPVVFVDDFVGSGNQFIDTWTRLYAFPGTVGLSFKTVASVRGGEFYYCPLVCTEYGAQRISTECPEVVVSAAHLVTARDGAFALDSRMWPPSLLRGATEFIRVASERAGIPAAGENGWKGFHELGLAVGFAHSVPDATLPIFYWENNGWNPLLRRT